MEITSKKGFTLIELMIVIVIMAIAATIIYPDYRSFTEQRRLSGAARMVMLDLMLARAQAVSMNRDVSLTFPTSSSNQYTFDAGGDAAVKNIQTGQDYFDVTLSADHNPIFTSRGIARNESGTSPVATVTLSNPAGSKTLTVNIAGQVTMN